VPAYVDGDVAYVIPPRRMAGDGAGAARGRYVTFQMAEVAMPKNCSGKFCG
jgi:hypothetical protein